ncbi:Copia protein, partial [Mucuna pruriens]
LRKLEEHKKFSYVSGTQFIYITSSHQYIKHIKVDYHYIRDEIQDDNIVIVHVQMYNQLVDILTKALDKYQFNFLLDKFSIRDSHISI